MSLKDDALIDLRAKYSDLMADRKARDRKIDEEYRLKARAEKLTASKAADYEFAAELKRVKEEHGLTVRSIQDNVFLTRSWDTWVTWKDMAGIESERLISEAKRKTGPELGWSFDDETKILSLYAKPDGTPHETLTWDLLENPPHKEYKSDKLYKSGNGWPREADEVNDRVRKTYGPRGYALHRMEIITSLVEAGRVEEKKK